MIFVTVGSVAPFDELAMKVDELAGRGVLTDVTIQIGNGKYEPKNAQWFRFRKDLNELFMAADLVITHTGAGTLFEVIKAGRKAIAVPNRGVVENHELAEKLSHEGYILFCKSLEELEQKLAEVKTWEPKKYVEEPSTIAEVISEFLLGSSK
jgi:beta-1,4-N-acetylglucosaminyltransferase